MGLDKLLKILSALEKRARALERFFLVGSLLFILSGVVIYVIGLKILK